MMETREGYKIISCYTVTISAKPRILIALSGCSFNCKVCFSNARDLVGESMTVDELIIFKKSSE